MTVLKAKGQQTTARQGVSEGMDVYLRALRDGTMVSSDWRQAAIMGGFGFQIICGAFSTGKVGGGNGTVIKNTEPELVLSVPNGTCVLPMRISVQVQTGAPTDAQEVELLVAVDQDKAWDAVGASTAATCYNLNTLSAKASACTGRQAFTSSMTTPVLDLELARKVAQYDIVTAGTLGVILDLVYEPLTLPIINGPAMIIVYFGGATATVGGYAQMEWLEFPENIFSV